MASFKLLQHAPKDENVTLIRAQKGQCSQSTGSVEPSNTGGASICTSDWSGNPGHGEEPPSTRLLSVPLLQNRTPGEPQPQFGAGPLPPIVTFRSSEGARCLREVELISAPLMAV